MAKLPNPAGAAARSDSIDSRSMERRSSFLEWDLLQDTQSKALYASGDFPSDLYLSAGCQKRAICGPIRRRANHGRRRESGNKEILKNFAAEATEAGKDPDQMPRMIEIAVDFNDNEQQAIEARKTYWAGTFVPALFTERIYTPTLSQQNGNAVGADTIRETVCISNDSEAHIKIARRYIDLGFDHLVFHSAGPDQRAFLEAYGRHVLPRLRGAQRLKIAVCKN